MWGFAHVKPIPGPRFVGVGSKLTSHPPTSQTPSTDSDTTLQGSLESRVSSPEPERPYIDALTIFETRESRAGSPRLCADSSAPGKAFQLQTPDSVLLSVEFVGRF